MFWLQIRLKPNIKKSTARGANENAKPSTKGCEGTTTIQSIAR
jgi:hypothetical protein